MTYGVQGTNGYRGTPDVSYDANPSTGVLAYDSTPYDGESGWWVVGGTSAGSPGWAGIQSLGLSSRNANFYVDANSASYPPIFGTSRAARTDLTLANEATTLLRASAAL